MKAVTKRLLRLEARYGPLMKAAPAAAPSGTAKIAQWLASNGFVRESNECLAETMCRATGMSMGDLRAALLRRANGLPV
jgi:hypothetical protein